MSAEVRCIIMANSAHWFVAMAAALTILGFNCYRYKESLELGHLPLWNSAIRQKLTGEGQNWGTTDLDKLLGDFDVSLKFP